MTEREQLHQIVDELAEQEVPLARRMLLALSISTDPVELAYLSAPYDDEPADSDQDGVDEALREVEAGEVFTSDEAKRLLGIA